MGVNTLVSVTDVDATLYSGYYIVPSYASNNPTGEWSIMIVAGNGGDVFQIICPLQSVAIRVRIKKGGGNFVSWKQISTL